MAALKQVWIYMLLLLKDISAAGNSRGIRRCKKCQSSNIVLTEDPEPLQMQMLFLTDTWISMGQEDGRTH